VIDAAVETVEVPSYGEIRQVLKKKGYIDGFSDQDFGVGFFGDQGAAYRRFEEENFKWFRMSGSERVPVKLGSQVEDLNEAMSRVPSEGDRLRTRASTIARFLFIREELFMMLAQSSKLKITPDKLLDLNPDLSRQVASTAVGLELYPKDAFLIEKDFVDHLPPKDQIKLK
jgi:hypothetical protein